MHEGMLADGRGIAAERARAGQQRYAPEFRIGNAMAPAEAGFVHVHTTDLAEVDRVEAAHGSTHLGWLALTAVRPA